MTDWHTILDQLEIPDGAVEGLSASHKPVLRGKLLQLPAADRPYFFVGQPLDVLKTLRTLLPDAPSGEARCVLLLPVLWEWVQLSSKHLINSGDKSGFHGCIHFTYPVLVVCVDSLFIRVVHSISE